MSSVLDHFGYPAPPLGEWRHAKWYNLHLVQEALKGMQHRVSSGMTPLPDLQVVVPTPREAPSAPGGSLSRQVVTASGSSSCPEIALKAPRTAAGKAQMAATNRKRGSGEGSKGIRLEDSLSPKHRRQPKQSSQHPCKQPCYEDTYEESDDSTESFDGPFSGSSAAVAASSTTMDTPPSVQ